MQFPLNIKLMGSIYDAQKDTACLTIGVGITTTLQSCLRTELNAQQHASTLIVELIFLGSSDICVGKS
ncbi:hypothetical protein NTG1052_310001 [Candidatus Nitrotoga sp. 1052]|nr:hypothetical protein NTG1052_310001 [Candidatus Nitrotoga sp. 1052]